MTNPSPVQIAFAADANYFPGLAVALSSVLKHTTGLTSGTIHVLDGGLKFSQRRLLEHMVLRRQAELELKFYPLTMDRFRGVNLLAGSPITYARLLLPELLEDVREVLYLDVDVYFGADLRQLWEQDIAGQSVAAVCDPTVKVLGCDAPWLDSDSPDLQRPYFNAGVLKINLDHWRRNGIGTSGLRIAQTEPEKCRLWDQTILNHLLRGSVVFVPEQLNFLLSVFNDVDSGIQPCQNKNLHYIAQPKPWISHSSRRSFKHWRAGYADGVSKLPVYMLGYRYWALYIWRERLHESRAFLGLCRVLLVTRLYHLIPGLSAATLKDYLNPQETQTPYIG